MKRPDGFNADNQSQTISRELAPELTSVAASSSCSSARADD